MSCATRTSPIAGAARSAASTAGGKLQRRRIRVVPRRLLATLRKVAQDPNPELRQRVLGILVREKDGFAQKKLLEGLKNPDKALVPPEKALQLLSYDVHAEAYRVARAIVDKPPNDDAKREALRLLAADATAAPLFEKLLRDKNELREIRQISASALHALKPEKLQKHAREILLDASDYDDIKATSLTALTSLATKRLAKDEALLKRVEQLSGRRVRGGQAERAAVSRANTGGKEPRSMLDITAASAQSEPQFAALVDALAADPDRREQLTNLLREDHPFYDQRASTAIVRMRGWVLLALARTGVPDAALIFVLEELDTGVDAYFVAAAARALRSYHHPTDLAPFVMRALTNIRYRDEPVSFESYGEYATSSTGTSPVRELLATLAWLGPHARGVLPELESLASTSAPGSCGSISIGPCRRSAAPIRRPRRVHIHAARRRANRPAHLHGRRTLAAVAGRSSRSFSRITTASRSPSGNSSGANHPSWFSSTRVATIR